MEVKEAIAKIKLEFDENVNSHIFLVDTNDLEASLKDVKDIVKYVIAKDDPTVMNQIEEENYLELIIIKGEGKEIKKDRILELQERIKTKPILSDYMMYIITPAEAINESAANKLLKTIEEPNSNVIGFLITSELDLLLPTIKSRCETINFTYESVDIHEEITAEIIQVTKELIMAIEKNDHTEFYKVKQNSKDIKENALLIENLIKDHYNMACNLTGSLFCDSEVIKTIQKSNDPKIVIRKAEVLNRLLNRLTKNMNTDLLLEKIFFDLKEVK